MALATTSTSTAGNDSVPVDARTPPSRTAVSPGRTKPTKMAASAKTRAAINAYAAGGRDGEELVDQLAHRVLLSRSARCMTMTLGPRHEAPVKPSPGADCFIGASSGRGYSRG